MAFFFLNDPQIAILVLLAEIIFIFSLLIGWFFGARRLNIDLHHRVVYIAVPVQFVLLFLWMLPKPLKGLEFLLNAPIKNWTLLAHFILGLVTIGLALGVVITFIIYRGIPLIVLRKARPVMIAILLLWILTFSLGTWNFYKKYYATEGEEEEEENGGYSYHYITLNSPKFPLNYAEGWTSCSKVPVPVLSVPFAFVKAEHLGNG